MNKDEFTNSRLGYANKWATSSKELDREGHYVWMELMIREYRKVLEIGTGVGRSTKKLIENGHKVISIDENLECLTQAEKELSNAGFNVILIKRGNIIVTNEGYSIEYDNIEVNLDSYDVILIEGDIYSDAILEFWLKTIKPFDAVICWLMGVQKFKDKDLSLRTYSFNLKTNPGNYRLFIQNRVYELADNLLRTSGILQIVDRVTTKEYEVLLCDAHQAQASVTSLDVKKIDFRLYTHSSEGVLLMDNYGELSFGQNDIYLASIISRKE
ncbi:class I SAM-dependent methyltransferase [bacterium]|nr:class I SAM-dependent methyltransferase [bacterium]